MNFNYNIQSPCIDSGDPNLIDPDGTRSEIGANYFIISLIGDCNNDNQINIVDIVSIVNNCILLDSNFDCTCGDINGDQVINVVDVVLIVNQILEL